MCVPGRLSVSTQPGAEADCARVVSSSDRRSSTRSQCALATELIVKLPLIMFCVLWLVHMIDSPHPSSLSFPLASSPFPTPLPYALVLRVRQNKIVSIYSLYYASFLRAIIVPRCAPLVPHSPSSSPFFTNSSFVYMHKKQKRIFIQSTRPSTSLIDSFGLIKSREASGQRRLWHRYPHPHPHRGKNYYSLALNDIERICICICIRIALLPDGHTLKIELLTYCYNRKILCSWVCALYRSGIIQSKFQL